MRGRELGCALLLLLAACDTTVQETLGLGKRAPDEFQVVRRAPLVLPPNYGLLPPGQSGGPQTDETASNREILTGSSGAAPDTSFESAGEQALVSASPVQADPSVREKLVGEGTELSRLDARTYLFILNFQRAQFRPRDETIDAAAEAARLRAAKGPIGGVVTARTGSTPLAAP